MKAYSGQPQKKGIVEKWRGGMQGVIKEQIHNILGIGFFPFEFN